MLKRYIVVYISFMVVLLAFLSCAEQDIIARVGNFTITATDFEMYLQKAAKERKPIESFSDKRERLEGAIDEKLIVVDAYRHNLDQDSSVLARTKSNLQSDIYMQVVQDLVVDEIITEEMVKERYHQRSHERKLRHIFLPVPKNAAETVHQQAKEQLQELRSQIVRGADFGLLARQFSRDSLTAGKNGDLGFITYEDLPYGTAFSNAVFGLREGQVSTVMQSDRGYHLVRLDGSRSLSLPPLEKHYEQIQRSFYRQKAKILDSTFYALVDRMIDYYDTNYIPEHIDSLVTWMASNGSKNNQPFMQQLPDLTPRQLDTPLATYRGGKYTVRDFFEVYERISPNRRPPMKAKEDAQKFLDRNVPRQLIVKYGYDKGYADSREVRNLRERHLENFMSRKIERMRVDEMLEPNEEQLTDYYEANKDKYIEPAKYKVQEVQVAGKEMADHIALRAKYGDDFNRLVKAFSTRSSTKNDQGVLGYITASQYGAIGRRAAKMKVGEVSDAFKAGSSFSIIKLLDIQPERTKPLEDVRNRVEMSVKKNIRQARYEEWIEELRSSIPVFVYESEFEKEFAAN